MTSMISSLQAWVVDTVYWSIFSAYSLSGALMGVAHGSVHGVQALAPRLTSVQGIKKLALGERAVDGRAPAGSVVGAPKVLHENGFAGKPEGVKTHHIGVETPANYASKVPSVAPATPPPTHPPAPAAPALNPVDLDTAFYTGVSPPPHDAHPPSYPAPAGAAPVHTHAAPTATHAPPMGLYDPPMATHAPPMTTHDAPMATHAPPMATHAPPVATHAAPVHSAHPAVQHPAVVVPADNWESASSAQVTPGHETGEDSTASLGSSPRSANGENVIKHPHMHKAKKGIKKLGAKIKKAFNPDSDSATTTA